MGQGKKDSRQRASVNVRPQAASKTALSEVPGDLLDALRKNKRALAAFEAFPPSHRREYITWIAEAKREETRQNRIETAVVRITETRSRKHTR